MTNEVKGKEIFLSGLCSFGENLTYDQAAKLMNRLEELYPSPIISFHYRASPDKGWSVMMRILGEDFQQDMEKYIYEIES